MITIEIRQNHFSKKYQLRNWEKDDANGNPIYSKEIDFRTLKTYLARKNVKCPNKTDLKFISDGFGYSYAWFDIEGTPVPRK